MSIRFNQVANAPDGDLPVRLNDSDPALPFAVIDLDTYSYMVIHDTGEADQLIKAAVEAKRLLSPPGPGPDPDACTCGHLAVRHLFAGRNPCTQCECEEFDAAVVPDLPDPEATAILAKAIEDGTPVIVEDDTCTRRPTPTSALRCGLPAGHEGEVHETLTDSAIIRWFCPDNGEDLFDTIATMPLGHAS